MDHFADILYNIELNNHYILHEYKQIDYLYFIGNMIYDYRILLLLFIYLSFLFTMVYIFAKFNWCNYVPVIDETYEHTQFIIPFSLTNTKEKHKIKDLDFDIFHRYHMLRARLHTIENTSKIY